MKKFCITYIDKRLIIHFETIEATTKAQAKNKFYELHKSKVVSITNTEEI